LTAIQPIPHFNLVWGSNNPFRIQNYNQKKVFNVENAKEMYPILRRTKIKIDPKNLQDRKLSGLKCEKGKPIFESTNCSILPILLLHNVIIMVIVFFQFFSGFFHFFRFFAVFFTNF
jgi:hypothetical protein